jgi:spore germination protein GerM
VSGPRRPGARGGRLGAAVAALAGLVVLAGCGVTSDAAPRPLAPSKVPFHLLDPKGGTSTSVPPAANVIVYFVDPSGHLVPVERAVTEPQHLLSVMNALVAGPTSTEQANGGLSSSITPTVRVLNASVQSGGVAVVNFNNAFIQIGSSNQVMAVAQVVYTATQQAGVSGVQIEVGGAATDVPVASNAEVRRPVTRADYAPQAPTVSTPQP